MRRWRWSSGLLKMVLWVVPGTALLGSSCASDIRDAVRGAGLDFVEGAAGQVLETFIPVDNLLAPLAPQ